MYDEHVAVSCSLARRREVWRQDPLGRDTLVAEEAVHALEFAVPADQPGEADLRRRGDFMRAVMLPASLSMPSNVVR